MIMTYDKTRMNERIAFAICFLMMIAVFCCDFTRGFRYPWSDEWDFVPILTGSAPFSFKWLWAQHNEHRIVIPKLVYFLSFNVVPDFKIPILLTLVAMGGCSFVMMTAALMPGKGNPFLLLAFPMLLLNMTLGYHQWGFHVQFASSTILLCLLLSAIVSMQNSSARSIAGFPAIAAAVVLLLLPLCGMNGVLPSLVLIPYFLLRGGNQARRGDAPGSRSWGIGIFLSSACAAMITGMIFVNYHSVPHPWSDPDAFQFIAATMHVFSAPLSFGPAGLMTGIIISCLVLFAVVQIIKQTRLGWLAEGRINWCKVDLLAFFIAMLLLALGLGWGRGGRGWPQGIDGHYSLLMVPLLCALFAACLQNGWGKLSRGAWLVILITFCFHGLASVRHHPFVDKKSRKIDSSIEAGAPVDQLLALHINDLFFEDSEHARNVVGRGLVDLKRYFIRNSYHAMITELRE